jgi:thioredoxin-dependent peroxiredoxin
MNLNDKLEDFSFEATSNVNSRLTDYQGRWLVLYFYPKDSTPGCTTESQNFRDNYNEFKQLNTEIFGISRDSLTSHENFKAKQDIPFELICDSDEALCRYFDVIKMKNMYGRQVRGIERSTFIIDGEGNLRHGWRKVKVKEHVNDVLAMVKSLQAS